MLTTSPVAIPSPGAGLGAELHDRLAGRDGGPHGEIELLVLRSAPSIASRIRNPARTARSGSSSCATGAPKTAITASPTNFSTVPP